MDQGRREEILAGVWQVIATGGLAAVSVRSVAKAAGVSPGRVQHYFTVKTELVRASAELMLRGATDRHPEALGPSADPATLKSLLMHTFGPAVSSRAGMSVYYSYVAAGVSDPWIADLLAEAKKGLVDAVAACLAAQCPQVADPDSAARELVLLSDGVAQAVFLGALKEGDGRAVVEEALRRLG